MNATMMRRTLVNKHLWRGSWSYGSAIVGGGKPGRLPKRRGERGGTAEAYRQADFDHRRRAFCQQRLGTLHAAAGLVPMWRHSERLLEYPREMTRAETNEVCQRRKRYPLVDMLL